jgi:predicted DNA-binding transcriptional regulator AlpA
MEASAVIPELDLRGFPGMSPEDLAGLAEIAKLLGVHKRTAQKYIDREDFPQPIGRLAGGRVWLRTDVEEWGRTHLPLPAGRPRKEGK